MKIFLFISLTFLLANAFMSRRGSRVQIFVKMTTPVLSIVTRDFEITSTLKSKIDEKITKTVEALGSGLVIKTNVVLRLNKYPISEVHSQTTKSESQIAEVTCYLKGGQVVHLTEGTNDMYSSISFLAHKLAQKLKQHKQKLNIKKGNSRMDVILEEDTLFDENMLLDDTEKSKISMPKSTINVKNVKSKKFDLIPMSVQDAAEQLNLIDHDFYLFRNKETMEVNVVYRQRNGTGYGHLAPSDVTN